jgi:cytochrome b
LCKESAVVENGVLQVQAASMDGIGRMKIRLWDLPTRVSHWLCVALVGALWWTGKSREIGWHGRIGYALLALLIFRFYWGLVGTSTARFVTFVRGPRAVLHYVRRLFATGTPEMELGHNPMGGWSVVLLLSLMLVGVVSGLFAVDIDGLDSGPLSSLVNFDSGRRFARLHHVVFNILLFFICLHVAAVLFYLLYKRRNLITPMITGSIVLDGDGIEHVRAPVFRSGLWALLGVVVATAVTWAIVSL